MRQSLKKSDVFLIVTFSLSNFTASVGACNLVSHVVVNWQLSKQGIRWQGITWPCCGLRCRPMLRALKVLRWQVTSFQLFAHVVHPRRQKNKRVVDFSIHSPFWNVLNTVVTFLSCSLSLAQIGPFYLLPTLPPPNSKVSIMNPSEIIFTQEPLKITTKRRPYQ